MAFENIFRNSATRVSHDYGTTPEGYARAAYAREAALQAGQGMSDDGTGAIARNEQFHANTGHIYDSGKPENMSSAGRVTASDSGGSFLGLIGGGSSGSSGGGGSSGGSSFCGGIFG